MQLTLYLVPRSHPAQAVRRMLAFKGLEHEEVEMVAGVHAVRLRLMGFRRRRFPR